MSLFGKLFKSGVKDETEQVTSVDDSSAAVEETGTETVETEGKEPLADGARAAALADETIPRPADFASRMRAIPGMDYDATLEKYGGSDDFMQTLLETVVSDGREKIELMKGYLAAKDYKNFGIEAHAAKSSMATIDAMPLSEHARSHEFAAKEGRFDYIDEDGPKFLAEYSAMLDIIADAMED